jgi:AmmeMemoRadiSam system protein A
MDRSATILRLAREAIEASFLGGVVLPPDEVWLREPRAAFVTLLQRNGALRGCVGSIEPRTALGQAVVDAARGAAFRDSRFASLSHAELVEVRIEISVLSPMLPLPVEDEADARGQIERSRPGVVLTCGSSRALFLPKVWTSIPAGAEFLQHLKAKACLSHGFWSPAIRLHVFTCEEFAEPDEWPARLEVV